LGTELQPCSIFIYLCVLLNILALSVYRYPEVTARNRLMNGANIFFTIIFLLELAIKLAAFGPVGYCRDLYNIVDGVITILTAISLSHPHMRVVVVLRTIRLAKLLTTTTTTHHHSSSSSSTTRIDPVMDFRRIMAVLSSTIGYAGYIYFALTIVMFVFAVAGRYYLGAALHMPEYGSFGR